MIYTIYIILYLKNLSIIMQLDYKYLREKYLKYFKGNENLCDHLLTDVIFGFNELYDILKDNKTKTDKMSRVLKFTDLQNHSI